MRNGACGGGFRKRKHSLRLAASTCLNGPIDVRAWLRQRRRGVRSRRGGEALAQLQCSPCATLAPPTKSILMSWLRRSGVGSRPCSAPAAARASSARPLGNDAGGRPGPEEGSNGRPWNKDRESSRHRPRCLALYERAPLPAAHFRRRRRPRRSAVRPLTNET